MRVSEQMLFRSSLGQLQRQGSAVLKAQEPVSSQKRVMRPSDDPVSAAQILRFKKTLAQVDQRLRNIQEADRFLSASEDALSETQVRLQRVSELAIDMANGSKEPADRKNAAREVRQIFDQLADLANTVHDGQYLFSGNKIHEKPFDFKKEWKGKYVGETPTLPVTIAAGDFDNPGNDTLNITVDGVNATVTLTPGDYGDGKGLATEIGARINEHPALLDAVSVAFVDDPKAPKVGHLAITSNAAGNTTGGRSSVTLNQVVGFKITEGINDRLDVPVDGVSTPVTLGGGTYPTGAALAAGLQEQMDSLGKFSVLFDTDHFVITPLGRAPFVQPLPSHLPLGDARTALGLQNGTHQLSGEEYLGDDKEISVILEPNVSLSKTLPGFRVFKGLIKKEIEDDVGEKQEVDVVTGVDIFADLVSFQTALETNDVVGIQTAITDMSEAMEQINGERASIGARLDRLESIQTIQEDLRLATASFQSEKEDIDLTQAISELVQQQNALEAARSVAARIIAQPTLIDFLR